MQLSLKAIYGNGSWREQFAQTVLFTPDPGEENNVINLYPEMTGQTLEGFGGAFTDSAGYVYSMMNDKQKEQLLRTYFSADRMNYQIARIHMDSCDFSTGLYEAMSSPEDVDMLTFSMERTEKYILPMLRDAERICGRKIELMLSPWSPPAFMKTNGQRCFGGKLKPEYREFWARYLCRYILEFRKMGFVVRRISLQNEPKAVQTWDSCIFTAQEEKAFLRDYMYPQMVKDGVEDVEVFLWDHNKERVYEWMRDIIDETTDKMIAGAAFHWYSGDHFDALDFCRRAFPNKKLIISESCIEFNKFGAGENAENAIRLSHEIIGDLNHGMCAFYDWNLLLDEKGGPNHVGNFCLAPFLYDTVEKKLQPQMVAKHFEHFSSTLVPGSVQIGSSRYANVVEVTAFRRPDGTYGVVFLNPTDQQQIVNLRMEGQLASFVLMPKSIASGVIA